MDAETFRKLLLENLSKLTDDEVDKIRDELDLKHDYEIDVNGITHIINKNLDTKKASSPHKHVTKSKANKKKSKLENIIAENKKLKAENKKLKWQKTALLDNCKRWQELIVKLNNDYDELWRKHILR